MQANAISDDKRSGALDFTNGTRQCWIMAPILFALLGDVEL